MDKKEAIEQLIATVLDGTELHLRADSYTLEENFESGRAKVTCEVHNQRTGAQATIAGEGVGLIDAFFNGIITQYSAEFPSLKTIRFAYFGVKADLNSSKQGARTDSPAEVSLTIANSDGKTYRFTGNSPSITRSSIDVVLQGVEFFINSERAYTAVYAALQHARKANRPDSVAIYTSQLATLVEATSYSSVLEQLKRS